MYPRLWFLLSCSLIFGLGSVPRLAAQTFPSTDVVTVTANKTTGQLLAPSAFFANSANAAAIAASITLPVTSLTGLGTGVATALAATPNTTGGVVTFGGNLGAATGTSLNLSGNLFVGSTTGAPLFRAASFSLGGPAYSFTGDDDTGIWRSGADTLQFVTGGTARVTVGTATEVTGDLSATGTFSAAGINSTSTSTSNSLASDLSITKSGTVVTLVLGAGAPGENSRLVLRANATQNAWRIASSETTSDALEFAASTAGGGVVFAVPIVKLLPTSATISVPTAILGTTTNDNAPTGYVGESVASTVTSGSPVSLTTSTAANVTAISLTAGDWDVSGTLGISLDGTTTLTYFAGGATTTSATTPSELDRFTLSYPAAVPGTNPLSAPIPSVRFSLNSTTTIYLVANVGFGTSTAAAFGKLQARRVR